MVSLVSHSFRLGPAVRTARANESRFADGQEPGRIGADTLASDWEIAVAHESGSSIACGEIRSSCGFLPTQTPCSMPDVTRALGEMRPVLPTSWRSPLGRARAFRLMSKSSVGRTPHALGKQIGGGCHLNRSVRDLIEQAGFRVERIHTGYMKGPKPVMFMHKGSARAV